MTSNNGLKPTSAADWKKTVREGIIVPFPSGLVASLRPVSVIGLLKAGKIPDFLTGLAQSVLYEEKQPEELANNLELLTQLDDLFNVILPEAFAEPVVVPSGVEPDENELSIDDLDDSDKQIAFNLAISGVGTMRLFRDRQRPDVQPVPDGKGNSDKGKRSSRRRG